MKLSTDGLRALLATHVVELKARRRRPKNGRPSTRRFLATNNGDLLNSPAGRIAFNFAPPTRPPKYNAASKNLVVAWDIMMSEYRAINADEYSVLAVMPLQSEQNIIDFWLYFNNYLQDMAPQQKLTFNDS